MPDDDDDKLFSEAMAGVNPLQNNRASLQKSPGAINRRKSEGTSATIDDTLSDEFIPPCDDFLEFRRPGIQNAYLKQIRNGKLTIDDAIDLHGYRRDDARKQLLDFIAHAQSRQYRLVLVVHGKGYNSDDNRPVLKAMVNKWLQSLPQVLAFVTAQPRDGGSGAVYVLLKKQSDEQDAGLN